MTTPSLVSIRRLAVTAFSFSLVAGCSAGPAGDDAQASEDQLISDADSITRRSDGQFDVRCRDGRTEIATATQVQSSEICRPQPSSDPFDPASCTGAPMANEDLNKYFEAGTRRGVAGTYQVATRRRTCTAVSGCSAWQAGPRQVSALGGGTWPDVVMKGGPVWVETYQDSVNVGYPPLPAVVLNLIGNEGGLWHHVALPSSSRNRRYFLGIGSHLQTKWGSVGTPGGNQFFSAGPVIHSGRNCVQYTLNSQNSSADEQLQAGFLVTLQ